MFFSLKIKTFIPNSRQIYLIFNKKSTYTRTQADKYFFSAPRTSVSVSISRPRVAPGRPARAIGDKRASCFTDRATPGSSYPPAFARRHCAKTRKVRGESRLVFDIPFSARAAGDTAATLASLFHVRPPLYSAVANVTYRTVAAIPRRVRRVRDATLTDARRRRVERVGANEFVRASQPKSGE